MTWLMVFGSCVFPGGFGYPPWLPATKSAETAAFCRKTTPRRASDVGIEAAFVVDGRGGTVSREHLRVGWEGEDAFL